MSRREPKGKIVLQILPCGLGNQLFQYAAGLSLARTWGVPLKLDISLFGLPINNPLAAARSYRLDVFRITAGYATAKERAYFTDGLLSRARRLVDYVVSGGQHALIGDIREHQRLPHPAFGEPPARRPVQMTGFWECADYVRMGAEDLRRELVFREPPDAENARVGTEIECTQGVSVHVRAGDLIENPKQAGRRFVPGSDYYLSAARRIASAVPDAVFYVFSDDIEYARKVVRLPYPTTFVAHNGEVRHHEDLRLMTHCKHHILACSTFSWWGAWLARSEGQHVIAPRVYFVNGRPPIDHHYPKTWTLI